MKTPRSTSSEKTSPTLSVVPTEPTLSSFDLTRAAVNLAAGEFTLGDRVFPIKDLSYDAYITFLGYLTPLIEVVVQRVTGQANIPLPGIDLEPSLFSPSNILSACSKQLPEMVQIICAASDPTITVDDVKALGKKPTVLASAVLQQITQNGMIKDFSDFFAQVLSVVKPLTA